MKYYFQIFFTIIMPLACSQWPPQVQVGRDIFEKNKENLEKIKEEFEKTNLVSAGINFKKDGLNGRETFEISPKPIDLPNEDLIVSLMKEMSILIPSFWRENGTTYFAVGLPTVEDTYFQVHFAASSDTKNQPKKCKKDMKEKPCGRCAVPLKNGWWIDYRWYPSEADEYSKNCREEDFRVNIK